MMSLQGLLILKARLQQAAVSNTVAEYSLAAQPGSSSSSPGEGEPAAVAAAAMHHITGTPCAANVSLATGRALQVLHVHCAEMHKDQTRACFTSMQGLIGKSEMCFGATKLSMLYLLAAGCRNA